VSLGYNLTATAVKLAAALITGSVSLLSEALHSATDVVASLFAYLGVRVGATPPDPQHPYGHGKAETLAGFGEAVLLIAIVGYLLFEGVRRLIVGSELQQLEWGAAVMVVLHADQPCGGAVCVAHGQAHALARADVQRAAPNDRLLDEFGAAGCAGRDLTSRAGCSSTRCWR
jgi:cation diffusion facilitator family transporter